MTSSLQVAANLDTIRQRVQAACQRCGREPSEITIVGASKHQPIERLRWAWEAGLRVYGENRVQEAADKIPQMAPGTWHLVGHLQKNKAARAVELFDVIESVHSVALATRLARLVGEHGSLESILAAAPAIPGRLGEALREHPELQDVSRLTLRESFRCVRLALWDEDKRRLVGFREARKSLVSGS